MHAKQRELIATIQSGDRTAVSRLVHSSIHAMLQMKLTPKQLSVLHELQVEHGTMLNKMLSQAFKRGWTRQNGSSKWTNAMHHVLHVAETMVRVHRLLNDGISSSTQEFKDLSKPI